MNQRAARDAAGASPLRVLVVDDSAVVRQILASVLGEHGGVHVEVAADPLFALRKMDRARPDVILLDLEMPRMHGLTFLRHLSAEPNPIPVVVCSGLAGPGTDLAIQALEEGAVGIVAKPELGVRDFLRDSARQLVETLRNASQVHVRSSRSRSVRPPLRVPGRSVVPPPEQEPIVAIGASTGGPEALRLLLESLPEDSPPVLVVQHMPSPFTSAFARRLDASSALTVREARRGDVVRGGHVYLAPGDAHLLVVRRGDRYVLDLNVDAPVRRHRPSVDVLFRSAAAAAGPSAVGILLTGMGDDGASGLLAMRCAGAWTIAQDEETSVIFGMPREAIAIGAAHEVLPLDRVASALIARAQEVASRQRLASASVR